ncbi:hypothetical protein [Labedaea rhizosphaerae]|uniref:Uncharacterized protein n=1 Tax=Labedaea rhizosphaerae TaxID=598644 RepID=A0A4V3CZU9_LABRH|nr:hypothetical protein [Labedaea rhizosphaerae]TDQ01111.1 hypothetical protein EV186_102978 [Labedaea rhizosphaerae]
MGVSGTIGEPDDDERRPDRFHEDELLGLDPEDPEARAFAEHLDRIRRSGPGYTVEGYVSGIQDFAESANRLGGHRRLTAGILVLLIMLGVAVAAWDTVVFVLQHWFGE